jgi:hypothetical protein
MSNVPESSKSYWHVDLESVERGRQIHHGAVSLARDKDIDMVLKPGQALEYAHDVLMMIIPGREIAPLEVSYFGLVNRLKIPKEVPDIEAVLKHQTLLWFLNNDKDVLNPPIAQQMLAWQIAEKLTNLPFGQEEYEKINMQYHQQTERMLQIADAELEG